MAADTVPMQVGNGAGRTRLLSLRDLDRRTHAFKRAESLIAAISSEAGGDDLTTGARQIIEQTALLCVLASHLQTEWLNGSPVDPTVLCTLANTTRRNLECVGLRRMPKTVPDLDTFLEMRGRANLSSAEGAP